MWSGHAPTYRADDVPGQASCGRLARRRTPADRKRQWSRPATRDAERKAKAVTLADYSTTWLEHRNVKQRTRVYYRALLERHINPTLGAVPLGHLSGPRRAELRDDD
jgi:Phage integrase, N-terminal SAM-like domain